MPRSFVGWTHGSVEMCEACLLASHLFQDRMQTVSQLSLTRTLMPVMKNSGRMPGLYLPTPQVVVNMRLGADLLSWFRQRPANALPRAYGKVHPSAGDKKST
jgi:hypothetical protein